MKKVKILCVGIGGYAAVYLKSLLECENKNFEIAGMVEIAPEGCEYYRRLCELKVPLYGSMEEFYSENSADLAIITTPIHLHKRQIMCALKNGSNVMCEKPLSGVSQDAEEIEVLARQKGKFVIIGYQWSYSEAVNALKKDITDGLYGAPQFLKSMVLWPRAKDYFTRGSGWAGKLSAADGTVINDSVASNAAAHYLHNMLYVTGDFAKSSNVSNVRADLLRLNSIENFDTAAVSFELECGARGLFIASHSTENILNPVFEYRFEKGTVAYNDDEKRIIGRLSDGSLKDYGNPFKDVNEKIYEAIEACGRTDYIPPCGAETAAAHVRCIEEVQKNKIYSANSARVKTALRDGREYLYIEGLHELLLRCYSQEVMPSDNVEFWGLTADDRK